MKSTRDAYKAYLRSTTVSGSKKASSYVRALDLLGEMLSAEPCGFEDCRDIWTAESVARLHDLNTRVSEEQSKKDASVWNIEGIAPSYLQNGFCSAALRTYQEFLVEHRHEQEMLAVFDGFHGEEADLSEELDRELDYPDFLLPDGSAREGREVVRSVSTRANQQVFRSIILQLYRESCCITGLDIPAVNRASHIIPWAEERSTRLDPRNGLCLSATYDAAFDKHLISFDDAYRLILSKEIKEHYTSKTVRRYFHDREGERITLPRAYRPLPTYLDRHRQAGQF